MIPKETVARAWRGHRGAGYRLFIGLGGAVVARACPVTPGIQNLHPPRSCACIPQDKTTPRSYGKGWGGLHDSPALHLLMFALASGGGKLDNSAPRTSLMGWRRKLRWTLHHMLPWPDNTGKCTHGILFLPDFDSRPGQPSRRLKAGFGGRLGPRDYDWITARDGCTPSPGVLDPDRVLGPGRIQEQRPTGIPLRTPPPALALR
eukprot:gene7787-biopygen7579